MPELERPSTIPYPFICSLLQPGWVMERATFRLCERQAESILTLPIHPGLSEDDIAFISATVNDFLWEKRAREGAP